MLRQKPDALFDANVQALSSSEVNYTLDDLAVTVTGLPPAGAVLKADGLTQVAIGDTLTAAELAELSYSDPSVEVGRSTPWQGARIYVPRNFGRLPLSLLADLPNGLTADSTIEIAELPSNGSLFLADGITAVAGGQAITAAQLCGLTFRPNASACGQISLLRYRSLDQTLTGEVLLVVGPDAPCRASAASDAADSVGSVTPVAVALLLEAGLSSVNSTAASAAVDPSDVIAQHAPGRADVWAKVATQIADRPAAAVRDGMGPADIDISASTILAHSAVAGAEATGSTEPDTNLPRHHIGSSTPPDLVSPKPASLIQSLDLVGPKLVAPAQNNPQSATGGSGSFQIANNAVLEIRGASTATVTFATSNGELILDHSANFHGVIGSASPTTPLSPNDLIDLKDLAFTSSMSASVHYDSATNISSVDFSNGSKTITLQFSGQDPNWIFASDGQGGTLVADPSNTNPISLENSLPGTPQSVWQISPGQDSTKLEGFTTAISTNVGGTVQFKIDNLTGNPNYQIQIYRLGYYGGDGARLITTLQHTTSVVQPAPITNPATGEVDAGNWSVTDSWNIPSTAVSGVYIANVVQGSQVFQIPFVVKNPSSTSDIVFQTDDETWQAYNGWGGANLYGGNGPSAGGPQGGAGAAYAVSYNRPITTYDSSGAESGVQDTVWGAEYSAIYWLEQNGYDVSYISGMDTATNGSLLLNHKIFMDVGHDEYWTDSQVANVQAAVNAGVNLAFMSGNEIFWQTQFAPSIDGSNTANRTLVTYKDSHFQKLVNPSGQGTGSFEAPTSWGGAGMPSNALTGTVFQVDQVPNLAAITIPYGQTLLRVWRNTSVANTTPGHTATLSSDLLGYEWDSAPDNGFQPIGLVDLSSTTLTTSGSYNTEFGNIDTSGTATHNLVEYRDPVSGALVFGAGTVFWSWGLSNQIFGTSWGGSTPDLNVQQATVNLFADMGVQPTTLQASLKIATASTDHTAPTSTISSVSSTKPVEGQSVTVTGTATDSGGGVIAGVYVSTDGGKTWHPASSPVGAASENWSYTFNAPAPGTYTIQSRAVDDSINLETPGSGVSYTAAPSTALSLFSASATPATADAADKNAVEVGFKFTSSTNGQITGIRFYKGSTNTGTHVVDLWSATGTLLATATSSNETASGWQQVNFSSPVNITAGTTYVASYHMTNGGYSDTPYYFDTLQNPTNGSLSAIASGQNGLFAYSSGSVFPNNVPSTGDNYWVDVVFNDSSQNPQVKNVGGFTVAENGTLTIAASTLLANATDPKGLPLSLASVSNPVNGTVSYNASTQTVTFTPNAGYAGAADFTFTVSDTSGATGSGQASINVTYPVSAQSLFGTNDTPSQVNSNDSSAVELGVKFTASTSGYITGIRFYKGSANTGPHIADLWSSTGTLLATANFTNETASGWQEINFANPVFVTAGTTYVASYHTASGNYSDSPNYFANPVVNGELTGTNGVYAYGTNQIFPTNSFNSTNYWVDVVFNGTAKAIANGDSGFVVNKNGSISIAASTLLANDTDTAGLPISIASVGNQTNGTVSYDPNAKTVTFVPTAGYTGPASFTYTISDTGGSTASAAVSLFVNDPSAETLFSLSSTPSIQNVNDASSVELGVKFTADASGVITGLRFYKGAQNTGTHVADLWSSNGTLLATATFSNETASGWQQVNFATPVSITAGTTYVASYHTSGFYSMDSNYFTSPAVSGDLTAQAGVNGVYSYGSGSIFPANTSGNESNYWVDVVYTKTLLPPVAHDDSGFVVGENGSITISASTLLANDTDPNGLTMSIKSVSNGSNGSVSYDPNSQSVTFTPSSGYTGTASFSYSITDSGGGVGSANAYLLVNDPTTASLFSPTSTPSIVTANDSNAVELGVKFTSSQNGQITGLRFYKGPQNTGTHVADLWSSTGTLLATATFTNETPSGWQQVNFATPVAITAGTTYVASYHTNTGEYSVDPNLFATALTNGPLTAPSSSSSGGNGVYAYGSSSLFPTNSFNSSSYGVDVVFKPQLAA
ncbi:DUF4082 domain-containing protein [Bradyrhizobium sp. STM 3562]|uniref:DUF4082 domain-containing protein n=1 Tax=Bradyrhizobium sp. STM 3562 TaxID=578924 RepID=UPI00388F5F8C